MRKPTLMGFALLAGTIVFTSRTLAAEPRPETAPRWEYRVVTKDQVLELGKNDLAAGLNKFGDEGWELVAVEPAYHFKRSKDRRNVAELKHWLLMAQSDVEASKDRVSWAERMVKKGYLTVRQLEAEMTRLRDAEFAVERIKQELKTLPAEPKPTADK